MNSVDEESKLFWKQIEEQKDGKVIFFTFATFLGRSGTKPVTLGGLLYKINEQMYFEDFEKDNWFAKIISKKQKYEKTEFSFSIADIENIKVVTKGSALNCVSGIIKDSDTKPLSNIMAVLFQSVVQVLLQNGTSLFFDIMREKEFIKAIEVNPKSA
jgi:hypothetical protein